MTDADRGTDAAQTPNTVGERLRAAREAQGLSLEEIAARTRVPLRHLEAVEASNFGALPSSTYAVGFARGYARAVGIDEVTIARDTRAEVARTVRAAPAYQPYEIADPKRVPSRGVVILATGLGIAVLVLGLLFFATTLFRGGQSGTGTPPVVAETSAPPVSRPTPTPVAIGQVRITADDEVWVRIYDAANTTLKIGTLKPGETFDVPAGADNPMINVGRPDKLTVTLNGSAVAPLGSGERAIKDVPIGAAALAARASGQPVPGPQPSPSATEVNSAPPPSAQPRRSGGASPTPRADRTPARRADPRPRPSPSRAGPENLLPSGFGTQTP